MHCSHARNAASACGSFDRMMFTAGRSLVANARASSATCKNQLFDDRLFAPIHSVHMLPCAHDHTQALNDIVRRIDQVPRFDKFFDVLGDPKTLKQMQHMHEHHHFFSALAGPTAIGKLAEVRTHMRTRHHPHSH